MHEETLYLETKNVLERIRAEGILKDFYLAGGTALALQLGHRKSIDLDFFSKNYPSKNEVLVREFEKYHPTISMEDEGTLSLFIDEVKVSFFKYKYKLLEKPAYYNGVKLASVLDIACMKLIAISQRGAKKDFVDTTLFA